jgi:superfamily II DNA or RNA helicase
MNDHSFGELFVDGQAPTEWRHVFASVQSLSAARMRDEDLTRFDVVIVDEFHHAEASTYQRLLERIEPRLLLGMTATPERSDGVDVRRWFDDRAAFEMRLWDALDQRLLSPFQYFGVGEEVDLSSLTWRRGAYAAEELSNVLTGDDARVRHVLRQVHDIVEDPRTMRALGFCVSVTHAQFMAQRFNEAGIAAEAVLGETKSEDRAEAIRRLRSGELQVLFTVDLFNEGFDVPDIDTVLFLRPTESATLFLQQLGRGLRKAEGKACLTVLDFIGRQHQEFRFDLRFRAITGRSRRQVERDVEEGFPLLPSGCSIQLDRVAQDIVLRNVRQQLKNTSKMLVREAQRLAGEVETLTLRRSSRRPVSASTTSTRQRSTAGPESSALQGSRCRQPSKVRRR